MTRMSRNNKMRRKNRQRGVRDAARWRENRTSSSTAAGTFDAVRKRIRGLWLVRAVIGWVLWLVRDETIGDFVTIRYGICVRGIAG